MEFQRLIRFVNATGAVEYGDLGTQTPPQNWQDVEVDVLTGSLEAGFQASGRREKIQKLLCPLPRVPMIVCIGLNYRHHAIEANFPIPSYPIVFTKPPDALAGPLEDIPIHPDAQSMLDYEGELTVVIGKDAKNVSEAQALEYVLGYTGGNDVSARNFQLPETSGGQFCYAKSFDKFAPIGPCIVSTSIIPDPQKISYKTLVNGSVRQQTNTSDMIFSVAQIIAYLSRGTTLRKHTIIQTGTPSGVGVFMDPKGFLKHGDVVEVNMDGIGAIQNTMVFEK